MANKRFSDEVTFSVLPEEIFPLWFSDVCDFEVVKNHSRIVYRVRADGECCYLKVRPEAEAKDVWPLDKRQFELSTDFARHLCDMAAPSVRPVASKRNRYVEEHMFSDVYMVVQVTAEVPGTTVSPECNDPAVYYRCGIAWSSAFFPVKANIVPGVEAMQLRGRGSRRCLSRISPSAFG